VFMMFNGVCVGGGWCGAGVVLIMFVVMAVVLSWVCCRDTRSNEKIEVRTQQKKATHLHNVRQERVALRIWPFLIPALQRSQELFLAIAEEI
jgi:Na+/melibiose symporter-like transporter